jgi:isopentenyl-diphosphate Delta-isomerase
VGVETHRAEGAQKALGQLLWNWGVPTAASVVAAKRAGYLTVFATGGVQNGLEVGKALALGASVGGIARPVLQALQGGGPEGARAFLEQVELELRATMLLVGAGSLKALKGVRPLVTGQLRNWCDHWETGPKQLLP